ncbi:TM2 domain-containing protein [Mucilaginibacter terrae]|uniref:TM2 domain-containing membrane protein YozV n=1 Tax=Mucilaginibacter terrae TaxID=1955052 RepID=A0ABU3GTG3_9SPHI|nr:TM2 domain-containing protein [Mucilaginibacter terrae]MDT3403047.1 TM2 domain-containing membrane protein YozV [Mucilaginibacter terrae]
MDFNYFAAFSGITPEEVSFLQQATAGLDENQQRQFITLYGSKRRSPQDILLFTLLGFLGIAGVQRFIVGQIGMGIIYFITGGFCGIGTIVDLINHKDLATEYNKQMAYESMQMLKMRGF